MKGERMLQVVVGQTSNMGILHKYGFRILLLDITFVELARGIICRASVNAKSRGCEKVGAQNIFSAGDLPCRVFFASFLGGNNYRPCRLAEEPDQPLQVLRSCR